MQNKILKLFIILLVICYKQLFVQNNKLYKTLKKKYIGSSMFMLINLYSKNHSDFDLFHFVHHITQKDIISLEVKTIESKWLHGIPCDKSFQTLEKEFLGYIKCNGFAIVNQQFSCENFYTSVNIIRAWQNFVNKNYYKIDNGLQIFNTFRICFQIRLFMKNLYLLNLLWIYHIEYIIPKYLMNLKEQMTDGQNFFLNC